MHILIVEDSPLHVAIIRNALEKEPLNSHLSIANSLEQARACLSRERPDAALVDLLLPDGNGMEFLRDTNQGADFPVIIMTGAGDEQMAVETIKAGATDYIVKSVANMNNLSKIIKKAHHAWSYASRHRKSEAALREQGELFLLFFNAAASAMVILSPEGRILRANPAFCGFMGYSGAELNDLTFENLIHCEKPAAQSEGPASTFSWPPAPLRAEKHFLRKCGEIRRASIDLTPIVDGTNKPWCLMGLIQDSTAP